MGVSNQREEAADEAQNEGVEGNGLSSMKDTRDIDEDDEDVQDN